MSIAYCLGGRGRSRPIVEQFLAMEASRFTQHQSIYCPSSCKTILEEEFLFVKEMSRKTVEVVVIHCCILVAKDRIIFI